MLIHSYNPEKAKSYFEFYILCKGMNSGKPLLSPCRNCFVCTCSCDDEKDFLFWLCWGLWKTKQFEPLLCGSVIPFIRIDELRREITRQAGHADQRRAAFLCTIQKLLQIEQRESDIRKQLLLLQQLKYSMLSEHIMR